ncbi:MAG: DUF58 domain-containing protein [Candidatus Binatota bacterium]
MADGQSHFLQPEFLKKLERLRLVAKRLSWSGAKGEHPTQRKGFSLEFSDYRKYQRGDDLRYVDWNVYRRLGKLFLKLFTAEEEMNIYLLLDTSRSMAEGDPPKIEYAKSVAAALGYIGLKNLDKVGGATFSSGLLLSLELGRGKKQILTLFNFLGDLSCEGETDLRASVRSFSSLFPRSGLVVLVSDLFDPRGVRAGLEDLVRKKYQPLVIHILDEKEAFPGAWGDVSLFDVESEREKKIFLDGDLVRRFREELQNYFDDIESFCRSRQIDYLRTTTATPFEDFVLLTLRQVKSVR